MKDNVRTVAVEAIGKNLRVARKDCLAVEEPLEIRIHGATLTITMRTPGEDSDLAAGFLLSEGIIESAGQIVAMRHADANAIEVDLAPGIVIEKPETQRNFAANSSCGLCGKTSTDALMVKLRRPLPETGPVFSARLIHRLPDLLRQSQEVFGRTGGIHAAALFSEHGELLAVREDVGRHNAVDKLIGHALRAGIDFAATLIFVSGRAGFELIQKSAVAGIPILAAVGAPSSLAVETAQRVNMTLVGFVRDDRFNVYTGAWRVADIDTTTDFDAG